MKKEKCVLYTAPKARFVRVERRTHLLESFSLDVESPMEDYQDGGTISWD